MSFASCSHQEFFPHAENVLGTVCSINLFEKGTEKNYEDIFKRLREIDSEFNVNLEFSDVSRINAASGKKSVEVSNDVVFVLKKSLETSVATNGKFDPTIGPIVKLWGINTERAGVPESADLEKAKKLVDYRKVQIDEAMKTVFLTDVGMSLDLGGIAKGFAADEIAGICRQKGIKRAVIDLGGNIYIYGRKKDKSQWKIGVKNPFDPDKKPALVVSIDAGTVVTSGTYERFFESDGKKYHHIFDVSTGCPVQNGLVSATVVSGSSIEADAMSTSLFALGIDEAKKFLKENPELGVIFIDEKKNVYVSENIAESVRIIDKTEKKEFSFAVF